MTREFPLSEMHADLRDRFLAKVRIVDDETSCWEWTGATVKPSLRNPRSLPYGRIKVGGSHRNAHRIGWEMANGCEVPPGLHILHSCDNPRCVRPSHVRAGTPADNAQDAIDRGRHSTRLYAGEGNPNCKLTEVDVRAILSSSDRRHITAARFGVTTENVRAIVYGKTWRHVSRDEVCL